MTNHDILTRLALDSGQRRLADVHERCTQALQAYKQRDYRLVLSSLKGLELDIGRVRENLRRYIRSQQYKKQKKQKGGRHG